MLWIMEVTKFNAESTWGIIGKIVKRKQQIFSINSMLLTHQALNPTPISQRKVKTIKKKKGKTHEHASTHTHPARAHTQQAKKKPAHKNQRKRKRKRN